MFRGRRAALVAVCAVALAAVTAGCGGGSTSSALQLDPVAAAATKTQNAGAVRFRYALALSGPRLQGRTVPLRGSGAIDGKRVEMRLTFGSMAGRLGPALAKVAHASMKEVALEQGGDYVVYLQLGALSSPLPGGKQWVKVDLTKLGKSAGLDLGSLMSGSQLQPADLLSMLEAEGAGVEKLGPATIHGLATTRYRVKIDMAKALESKGLASPLLSRIAAHLKTVTANVWVAKDGLVRQMRVVYRVPQAAMHLAMTIDLYDYGAHVTIAAPPSSAVFDATQFAQQGLGSH
jgi:hypothetical protein